MTLITAKQAAELTGAQVGTVDSWRRRNLPKPVRRADHVKGKPLLYFKRDGLGPSLTLARTADVWRRFIERRSKAGVTIASGN